MELSIDRGNAINSRSILRLFRRLFREKDKTQLDRLTSYFAERLSISEVVNLRQNQKVLAYCSYAPFFKDIHTAHFVNLATQLFGPNQEIVENHFKRDLINGVYKIPYVQKFIDVAKSDERFLNPLHSDIYLGELGVSQIWQRKGLASLLVGLTLNECQGRVVYTNARDHSGSEQLFLKMGFSKICRVGPWWENGDGSTLLYNLNGSN